MQFSENVMAGKAYYYFNVGLKLEHAMLLVEVKDAIAKRSGSDPSGLTIMLELMRSYLGRKE